MKKKTFEENKITIQAKMCYVIKLNLIEEVFHQNIIFFIFLFELNILKQTKNEHIYTDKQIIINKEVEKHIKLHI